MNFPDEWVVPVFSDITFWPKQQSYALVIPVIDEGERIKMQLSQMCSLGIHQKVDIIIADGGSTDGSLGLDFLHECGIRTLLVKKGPGKLSAQLRMAYAWALTEGYQGIITIDGNGKDSIDSIESFIIALKENVDYAQASRFIKGGKHTNTPLIRLLAIRLLHAPISSLGARYWFTDTTQGFRAYSSRYLLDERVKPFRDCFMDYELLAYLTMRAKPLGYTVKEIPTSRNYPLDGNIPTKIKPFAGSLALLKVLLAACLGRYNP